MIELELNRSETSQIGASVDHKALERIDDSWAMITKSIADDGNRDAFGQYYQAFFDTMFLTVKRTTGFDESTCLDIVQDAMLKAVRKMKVFRSRDDVAAWSVVVAKTSAYDFLRRQSRQKRLDVGLADSGDATAVHSVDSDAIDSAARLLWVEEQLRELPAELSSMISLKYRLGWTLKQIGEKFGLKTGAVDGKIRRAVNDLAARAAEEFSDE